MDDIIIKNGTEVVLNRDLNVRDVTVARKGTKIVCKKDVKKGDTEVTLSYEGCMEFDIPVEYISKSENTSLDNEDKLELKRDCEFMNDYITKKTVIRPIGNIRTIDSKVIDRYEKRVFGIPVESLISEESKSVKNDIIDDKLRWDLLPMEEIEDIVRVYHAGAKKYGPNNWQNLDNGFERYRAAMFRHMMEYMKGERIDSDTGAFHLAQCAWNCIAMLWYDKHGKGLIPLNKEEKK